MEQIKYATIIPLIGGMTLGHYKKLGNKPEMLISHKGFAGNDSNLTHYFQDVPRYDIDEDNVPKENVDFVSSVCPCAGLSQLNTSSSKGSEAKQNDWMYQSAEYILENFSPTVYWGENAPGLYTTMGQGVVENLKKIGAKYGYSVSLAKTSAYCHGLAQHRVRTFYFFWKGQQVPYLNWHNRETQKTIDDFVDDREYEDDLYRNPQFNFVISRYGNNWRSIMIDALTRKSTLFEFIFNGMKDGDAYIDYCKKYFPKCVDKAVHIKSKLDKGMGFWDASPRYFKERTGAIVGPNFYIIHPWYNRYLNRREIFNLMGFPKEFTLYSKNINHIAQNVPVNAAEDFTGDVVDFIKGRAEMSQNAFMKQDNVKQRIDKEMESEKKNSLF